MYLRHWQGCQHPANQAEYFIVIANAVQPAAIYYFRRATVLPPFVDLSVFIGITQNSWVDCHEISGTRTTEEKSKNLFSTEKNNSNCK